MSEEEEGVASGSGPSETQTGAGDSEEPQSLHGAPLPPLALSSFPLLLQFLALSGSPGGLSLLPLLAASGDAPGIQKAEKISLIERYGQQAGRFRETTGNVAAIDFGTTFCSVAYTTVVTGYDGITTLKLDQYHSRVPTAILLEQNGSNSIQNFNADDPVIRSPVYKVDSFGYDAQEQHAKLRASERHNYLYFEHFKMSLHQDEVSISSIIIMLNALYILINRT